jgi:hypothetical protein
MLKNYGKKRHRIAPKGGSRAPGLIPRMLSLGRRICLDLLPQFVARQSGGARRIGLASEAALHKKRRASARRFLHSFSAGAEKL